MKKFFYILAFIFLGLLVSTVVHGALEIPALSFVFGDGATGEGFFWQNWDLIHMFVGTALWVLGGVAGFFLGKKYWHIIYIEKRYPEKFAKK